MSSAWNTGTGTMAMPDDLYYDERTGSWARCFSATVLTPTIYFILIYTIGDKSGSGPGELW